MKSIQRYVRLGAALVVPAVIVACSSSKDSDSAAAGIVVTAVSGAADTHCKGSDGSDTVVTVDAALCTGDGHTHTHDEVDSGVADVDSGTEADASAAHTHDEDAAASSDDAGVPDHEPENVPEEEAAPLFGSAGSDDDCKYHVEWTSSAGANANETMFTVKLASLADGKPVTGADPNAEVFLSDTHPAPNSDQKATEGEPGVYMVGPVAFDESGKWTVRFHFFETCSDSEASPHGHVGFFVNVP